MWDPPAHTPDGVIEIRRVRYSTVNPTASIRDWFPIFVETHMVVATRIHDASGRDSGEATGSTAYITTPDRGDSANIVFSVPMEKI
jgi:hypothetical protein